MWQKAAAANKVRKVAVRLKRLDEGEGADAGDRLRFRLRPSQVDQAGPRCVGGGLRKEMGRTGKDRTGQARQDSLAAAAVHCSEPVTRAANRVHEDSPRSQCILAMSCHNWSTACCCDTTQSIAV